jgi:hypothetical protein
MERNTQHHYNWQLQAACAKHGNFDSRFYRLEADLRDPHLTSDQRTQLVDEFNEKMTFLLFDDHIEKAEETFARVLQRVYASTDKPPFASHSQSDSPRRSVIRPQEQVSE